MPLSEHEQRELDGIEEHLTARAGGKWFGMLLEGSVKTKWDPRRFGAWWCGATGGAKLAGIAIVILMALIVGVVWFSIATDTSPYQAKHPPRKTPIHASFHGLPG